MVYVPGLVPDIVPGQAAASGVGIGLRGKAGIDIIIHQYPYIPPSKLLRYWSVNKTHTKFQRVHVNLSPYGKKLHKQLKTRNVIKLRKKTDQNRGIHMDFFTYKARVSQNHQIRWLSDALALYIEKSGENSFRLEILPDF